MALTLADANQIVQGALDKAKEMNIRISVAVCDAGGRLVAFSRMDGAIWASVYGCQGKAIASVAFARPSGELAERAGSPIVQGIAAAEGGHGRGRTMNGTTMRSIRAAALAVTRAACNSPRWPGAGAAKPSEC